MAQSKDHGCSDHRLGWTGDAGNLDGASKCVQRAGRSGVERAAWLCSGFLRRDRCLQEVTPSRPTPGQGLKHREAATAEEEVVTGPGEASESRMMQEVGEDDLEP